jgi:hypothetical protein
MESLKGIPDSIKALGTRLDETEKRLTALPPAAPAAQYRAPVDDRSATEKGKDGELSFGAFLRGLAIKAMGGDFEDTPIYARAHGEKEYRDA